MISESTAEAALLFGYSDPLVTFSDWKCMIFSGFGCLELRFELKIEHRAMLGSNRARCTEKYTNLTAQGSIWERFEARWGLLGTPLTSLVTI